MRLREPTMRAGRNRGTSGEPPCDCADVVKSIRAFRRGWRALEIWMAPTILVKFAVLEKAHDNDECAPFRVTCYDRVR